MAFSEAIWRHAARNVLRQRRRVATAVGAIAFGVISLILAGAFIEWIFWATREGTIQAGLGHIHVTRQGFFDGGTADPGKFRLPDDSPVLAALKADSAIRAIAPRVAFSGLVSHGETTISFLGEGVDPGAERKFGDVSIIVDGNELASDDSKGVIVGHGLAANLGAKVGDQIVLLISTASGGVNAVEARVRGLFATVSKAYDDSAMRVPLALAQELTRASGAHRWILVLDDTARTATVLARLRAQFASHGLDFVPWYELADFYKKTEALLSRQMGIMFAIIGIIIMLTISNSMMMSVMERTSEIGTSLALGTRRSGILAQFLCEGVVLGIVGAGLGAVCGIGLAWAISAIGIPMPPPPGQARGFTAEMIVTAPLVAESIALAVSTALVAAGYPAWRASRLPVVDALRTAR